MNRRAFIGTLTGGLLAAPLAAEGQAGRVPHIGVIGPVQPASPTEPNITAFREALRSATLTDSIACSRQD